MRKAAVLLLLLWSGVVLFPAVQKARTSSSPKKSSAKKTPRSSSRKKVTTRRSSRRPVRRRRVAVWRRGQQTPTPDRYREIQQALIDKGFLEGPATGEWGAESTEALKRFQQDQKLQPTGKLDALSLIGLGLGPKRDLSARSDAGSAAPEKAQP